MAACAVAALAVTVDITATTISAFGRAGAAAVDPGFATVLDPVRACWGYAMTIAAIPA